MGSYKPEIYCQKVKYGHAYIFVYNIYLYVYIYLYIFIYTYILIYSYLNKRALGCVVKVVDFACVDFLSKF